MKFTKHLPVFTFACALGFAPVAFAQTSTGGTMAPMPNSTMAPAAQAPAMAAPGCQAGCSGHEAHRAGQDQRVQDPG